MAQNKIGLYQIQSGDNVNVNLEEKLSNIITKTGLDNDGTYTPDNATNYISNATDLKDADKKLDAEILAVNSKIDAAMQGIKWKEPVRVSTTEALPAHTYASGVITASSNGALPQIDGITLSLNERLLVRHDGAKNGIYKVTALGDAENPFTLTRADDASIASEFPQMAVFVKEGTEQADQAFVLTNDGSITLGTTSLNYVQFTGVGQVTAGDGLKKTGNKLDVVLDNSTLELSGTEPNDFIRVKADGITKNEINSNVAGSGLGQAADGALEVKDLEVTHLKSGVLDTDISAVSSSHDTLASAKAIKTYVDARIEFNNEKIMASAFAPISAPKFDLVKNYTVISEDITSEVDTTLTLPNSVSYELGKGNLMVYINGVYQHGDYTEASSTTVTFEADTLTAGDVITYVIGKPAVMAYSVDFDYDVDGRIEEVAYTGDMDRTITYTYTASGKINTETIVEYGKTTTKTYAYDGNGRLTGITAVIS